MARLNKEQEGRNQGMLFALEVAKKAAEKGEDPVKVLEKEIEFRNIYNTAIPITPWEREEIIRLVTQRVVDVISIISALTLRDEFDMGEKRITRFLNRLESKTQALVEGKDVNIEDYIRILKEELGMDFLLSNGLAGFKPERR